jgi:RHH-type proline utilization regulon transcriptional repressor/proline dehydrogenase/delta 1-pyrroline-5-carboxylate dehydrogenase
MDGKGHFFFAPRLYELSDLSILKEEVFGPCVHIIRYKGNQLDGVIEQINNTGFGLTMGIHTRIEGRAEYLAKASAAGNIYVNRNMIGAVVGVQPFGGRGLSGTGPKAGGPRYLRRLVQEKAFIDNTQATNQRLDEIKFLSGTEVQKQIEQLMNESKSVTLKWRITNLNERCSFLRQLLAKISSVKSVDNFADDLEQTLIDSRAQLNRILALLDKPLVLPGPTGESNKLYLEPRGCMVCYADKDTSFNFWAISIISALATGNTVITVVSDTFYDEANVFRDRFIETGVAPGVLQVAKLEQLQEILGHDHIAGAVIGSACERNSFINNQFANRVGAILPVITSEHYDSLINRLVTEKTVSIDITASGGNTSLMTLDDD